MDGKWAKRLGTLGLLAVVILIGYETILADIFPLPAPFRHDHKTAQDDVTIDSLAAIYRKGCPKHQFRSIQILSRSPDMMLIDGFMTEVEAEFLVRIAYIPSSSEENCDC
jgi:hypothetical protein